MMNPNLYFREVWNEEKTANESASVFRSKGQPHLARQNDLFTYTVHRLQSGCRVYQLVLAGHN